MHDRILSINGICFLPRIKQFKALSLFAFAFIFAVYAIENIKGKIYILCKE